MRARLSVVLDTNVLVSSLWKGPPHRIIRSWRDGAFWLLVSEATLREYLDVLSRFVSPVRLREWAQLLTDPSRSVWIVPHETVRLITDDPPDNRFLECAIAGSAAAIVSGDRHLLRLRQFRNIPILTPTQFLTGIRLP